MANFNPEEYETVDERIKRFKSDHPESIIETWIEREHEKLAWIMFGAKVIVNDRQWATGFAIEKAGQGFVNKTHHVENCETSAVGRALANLGYSGDKRPTREEMQKPEREEAAAAQNPEPVRPAAPQESAPVESLPDFEPPSTPPAPVPDGPELTFGKYKGKRLTDPEVPVSYLTWLQDRTDPDDPKYGEKNKQRLQVIEAELERRKALA